MMIPVRNKEAAQMIICLENLRFFPVNQSLPPRIINLAENEQAVGGRVHVQRDGVVFVSGDANAV